MKILIRQLILIIMRSSILVGGQAVINGVMMRVPGAYSTSVRLNDGSIKSNTIPFTPLNEKNNFFKLPIIRGAIGLYEAMKIWYGTLNWSASMFEEEQNKTSPIIESIMNLLAIIFAISLFRFYPFFLQDI